MDNVTIQLFDELTDSGELVFSRDLEPITAYDGYWYAWDEAHEQATLAYEAWCKDRTRQAYTVYLAAQERADAAENALARQAQAAPGER
jgi:hypothetical protein